MLDVDGGEDVDAGRADVGDVLVALGVLDTGDVGVGELVDQAQLRPPRRIPGRSISSRLMSR